MAFLFVYGSLKKGLYNHSRFGFDRKARFVREAALKGARMYNLGYYPCVILTGKEGDSVRGEIYSLPEGECLESIRGMELGAGYVERKALIGEDEVIVFVFERAPAGAKEVPGGEWKG